MKKINHPYPSKTYIMNTLHKKNGKLQIIVTHPQLNFSYSQIKKLLQGFDKLLKEKKYKHSIFPVTFITPLTFEKIYPYKENLWLEMKTYLKNFEIMAKCQSLLDDYKNYKVLVTPCTDEHDANKLFLTVQSVYHPTKKRLDWYKIPHSNKPIQKGTKHLAVYKCEKPKAFEYEKDKVKDLIWPK